MSDKYKDKECPQCGGYEWAGHFPHCPILLTAKLRENDRGRKAQKLASKGGEEKMTRYFVGDQLILEEPWPYRRLFALGQEVVINSARYIVLSAVIEGGGQIVRLRAAA